GRTNRQGCYNERACHDSKRNDTKTLAGDQACQHGSHERTTNNVPEPSVPSNDPRRPINAVNPPR
ncbi:hypothetical protein J3R83DRAFT_12345, partial [Lanmaoa asiatica]